MTDVDEIPDYTFIHNDDNEEETRSIPSSHEIIEVYSAGNVVECGYSISFSSEERSKEYSSKTSSILEEPDPLCRHYKSKLKIETAENSELNINRKPDIDKIDPREMLTPTEIMNIKEAFKSFDSDGDGKIVTTEIKELMQQLGQNPTDCYIKELIEYIDPKKRGFVTCYQFCVLFLHQCAPHDPHSILRAAFQAIEPDPSGFIAVSWLRKVLTNLGDKYTHEEVDCIYRVMCANEFGKFSYEEFIELILDS